MTYKLSSIEGNRQRLDGGAMFGNVPRPLWTEWIPPDERHRIELACRTFLIRDEARDRLILLEAGIGVFFEPKLQDRFGVVEPHHRLLQSLAEVGVAPGSIDLVILSHLHFDHVGGLLTPWRDDGSYELVFPAASYLVGRRAWARARAPHVRDRASFIPQLLELIEASDRLVLVDGPSAELLGPDFSFTFSDGHTPGMMLTELTTAQGSAIFCGDLIPGRPWVHLPVTMGYDRFPELLIDEKASLLARCQQQGTRLLYTHDPLCTSSKVARDDRGRYRATEEQATLRDLEL